MAESDGIVLVSIVRSAAWIQTERNPIRGKDVLRALAASNGAGRKSASRQLRR